MFSFPITHTRKLYPLLKWCWRMWKRIEFTSHSPEVVRRCSTRGMYRLPDLFGWIWRSAHFRDVYRLVGTNSDSAANILLKGGIKLWSNWCRDITITNLSFLLFSNIYSIYILLLQLSSSIIPHSYAHSTSPHHFFLQISLIKIPICLKKEGICDKTDFYFNLK